MIFFNFKSGIPKVATATVEMVEGIEKNLADNPHNFKIPN